MPTPALPPVPPGIHQPVPEQQAPVRTAPVQSVPVQNIYRAPHISSLHRSDAWEMRTWHPGKRCKTPQQLRERAKR